MTVKSKSVKQERLIKKTRRTFICGICNNIIERHSKVYHVSNFWQGKFQSFKAHEECYVKYKDIININKTNFLTRLPKLQKYTTDRLKQHIRDVVKKERSMKQDFIMFAYDKCSAFDERLFKTYKKYIKTADLNIKEFVELSQYYSNINEGVILHALSLKKNSYYFESGNVKEFCNSINKDLTMKRCATKREKIFYEAIDKVKDIYSNLNVVPRFTETDYGYVAKLEYGGELLSTTGKTTIEAIHNIKKQIAMQSLNADDLTSEAYANLSIYVNKELGINIS